MFLAYLVARLLIIPIVLHASTDPSIFLQNTYPSTAPLAIFAGFGNLVVIAAGVIPLIVFVFSGGKDRAFPHTELAGEPALV